MPTPSSKVCVYCAVNDADTRDHVPPRGFFKGTPAQFTTVPSCRACNNGATADDELIRMYISLMAGKSTPKTRELWDKGAHKNLKQNSRMRATASFRAVIDETGVERIAANIPAAAYNAVMGRITRGLYFHHTGRILHPSTRLDIRPHSTKPNLAAFDQKRLKHVEISEGAVNYIFTILDDDPDESVWVFDWYGGHWTVVCTG